MAAGRSFCGGKMEGRWKRGHGSGGALAQHCEMICKHFVENENKRGVGGRGGGPGGHGPGTFLTDFYRRNSIVPDCGEIICKLEGGKFVGVEGACLNEQGTCELSLRPALRQHRAKGRGNPARSPDGKGRANPPQTPLRPRGSSDRATCLPTSVEQETPSTCRNCHLTGRLHTEKGANHAFDHLRV